MIKDKKVSEDAHHSDKRSQQKISLPSAQYKKGDAYNEKSLGPLTGSHQEFHRITS